MVVEPMKSSRRRTRPARRTSRRPERRRRYRINAPRLILSLLLILLAGESVLAVLKLPWFEIRQVVIEGRSLADRNFVVRSAQIPAKSNIFTFPAHTIADRLRPNPIIKGVTVSRRFPNKLVVRITERRPYAVLSARGTFCEIDASGIPFRLVAVPDPKLPVLSCSVPQAIKLGKPITAPAFNLAAKCLRLAQPFRKLSIRKITVDPNNDLCLNTQDGILIRLGQPQLMEGKLEKAEQTIDLVPHLEYVDVTCPEAPALKPKQSDANPS